MTVPFEGMEITQGGVYEIPTGTYTGKIVIDTTDDVTINIKGTVKFTVEDTTFLRVTQSGKVTIHSENSVIKAGNSNLLVINNSTDSTATKDADVTVYGGIYSGGTSKPPFWVGVGTLHLNDVSVVDPDDKEAAGTSSDAVYNKEGEVYITGNLPRQRQ